MKVNRIIKRFLPQQLRQELRWNLRFAVADFLHCFLWPAFCVLRRRYITPLLFHKPSPELFERQLSFLAQRYQFISLSACLKKNYLPPNPMVVMFDDGWRTNYDLLPILRRYRCQATIFLCAGLIGTSRTLWNDFAIKKGRNFNNELKRIPNQERLKIMKNQLGFEQTRGSDSRDWLSLNEIQEMAHWVEFQSHGMFHPLFTRCDDQELKYELSESKRILEEILHRPVTVIAAPYGGAGERECRIAWKLGYQIIRLATNYEGLISPGDDFLVMRTIDMWDDDEPKKLYRRIKWAETLSLVRALSARGNGLDISRLVETPVEPLTQNETL